MECIFSNEVNTQLERINPRKIKSYYDRSLAVVHAWHDFLQSAGLDMAEMSKEEKMILQVKFASRVLGRKPAMNDFGRGCFRWTYEGWAIKATFGGRWYLVLEAAGLQSPEYRYPPSNEVLFNQVRLLTSELGRIPTTKEFDRDPRTARSQSAIGRFGSWINFTKAAGLDPLTDEEIAHEVNALAKKLGRKPTIKDYNETIVSRYYSYSQICKRFLSFQEHHWKGTCWDNFLAWAALYDI